VQTVSVAAFEAAAAAATARTLDGVSAVGGERAAGGGGGDTSEQDGPTLWSVAEDAHPQAGVTSLDIAAVMSNADAVVGGALRSKHGLVIVVTARDSNDVIALERATDECWRFVQVRAHAHTHHAVDSSVCNTRLLIAVHLRALTQLINLSFFPITFRSHVQHLCRSSHLLARQSLTRTLQICTCTTLLFQSHSALLRMWHFLAVFCACSQPPFQPLTRTLQLCTCNTLRSCDSCSRRLQKPTLEAA
jgi:hypothetical protein